MIKKLINKFDATQKSALINLALKPLSMVLTIIYTPLLLGYLGDEKYGLWSTILSIISWVNYCDIGIGQGLRNLLAKELSNKQYKQAQKSVSTAYVVLTGISTVLLFISLVMVGVLDWHKIFNTKVEMTYPLAISFVFICINFILALSNTLLYALQLSERIALRNCLVQLLNIIGLKILDLNTSGNLVLVSILFGASTSIIYIWNTVQIFKRHKELVPGFKGFDKTKVREISNVGIKFFVIQLACIALYTTDNILITNLFGGEAVTPFNIVYRAFNSAYAFLAALIVPYWSKTTAALAQNDIKWIKKSIIQLNIVTAIFDLGYIALAILFKPIAHIWLGRNLEYPAGIILVMCIYYCLYSIVMVNTQFINGIGNVNCQLIVMVFMGIANVPLSIFLAKNCGFGVVGIRLATTILMAVAAVIFPVNLYKIVKKIETKNINEGDR